MWDEIDSDDEIFKPKQKLTEEQLNEHIQYFENHPLTMQKIPENIQDNPLLESMQKIIYDDTPENIAKGLNDTGNKLLLKHKADAKDTYFIKQAIKAYDDGLLQNCNDYIINAKLYSNRAACNMKLKNYGKVADDCIKAIQQNPQFIKPIGQAYLYLYKYDEGIKYVTDGLKIFKDSKDLIDLQKQIQKKIDEENKKKQKDNSNKKIILLTQSLKSQNINLFPLTVNLPINRVPLPEITMNGIILDIIVYYPEFNQMDLIEKVQESEQVQIAVQKLLIQLPWDQNNDYQENEIQIYREYKDKGLKRISDEQLGQVIRQQGSVVRGAFELWVVSKKSKYYDQFIQENNFAN